MKFPFKELPGSDEDYLRPAVPVTVEGIDRAPQLCLLDTGSLHNRFAAWVAESAGIDLGGAEEQRFGLGGFISIGRHAHVRLAVGEHTWEAPVWFCDPWPLAFHLLGQEGFFRWFDVRIRAAVYQVEVGPERGRGMALPEDVREVVELRVSAFCDRHSPPELRDKMRLEFSIDGNAVTIVDRRPPWEPDMGDEWSSLDVAQLRFHTAKRVWTLWWPDSDERWHRFERAEASDVDGLLQVIDEDPTNIFWG